MIIPIPASPADAVRSSFAGAADINEDPLAKAVATSEKYGVKVKLVSGSSDNIKITSFKDLSIMEGLFQCE